MHKNPKTSANSMWLCTTFVLVLGAFGCSAHMNLYLNQHEVMRFLGLSAELYYVRDGQINEYALHFVVPIPAHVNDLAFTWQSLADRPLPYDVNILTSDPIVLPAPVMNISISGNIPTDVETFGIAMRCTGMRSAEIEVTIIINVMLDWRMQNTTELVLRRKKICLERDPNEPRYEDPPLFLETVIAPPAGMVSLAIGVSCALILVIIFIAIGICAHDRKRESHYNEPQHTNSFQRLKTLPSCGDSTLLYPPTLKPTLPRPNKKQPSSGGGGDDNELQRRIHDVTVQRCRVRLSSLLQEGTFGRIYRGTYNDSQEVLVKTVEPHANPSQVSMLLREGMSLWGVSHPGVLSILGVSVEDHIPPFLLFAAPNGLRNLKTFLQEPMARTLNTIQIVRIATELALALEHLHSHGLVHRDIAARNCVIDDQMHVKLADCSLSRDLYPSDYSCLGDRENRPIKWLAVEAFAAGALFSEASDTWSFGVLMWELCTLARQPYQEIVDDEMEQFLRDGYRLAQPINCPDELFAIMAYCWALAPLERPTFGQLQVCLNDFYTEITRYV